MAAAVDSFFAFLSANDADYLAGLTVGHPDPKARVVDFLRLGAPWFFWEAYKERTGRDLPSDTLATVRAWLDTPAVRFVPAIPGPSSRLSDRLPSEALGVVELAEALRPWLQAILTGDMPGVGRIEIVDAPAEPPSAELSPPPTARPVRREKELRDLFNKLASQSPDIPSYRAVDGWRKTVNITQRRGLELREEYIKRSGQPPPKSGRPPRGGEPPTKRRRTRSKGS